MNNAELDKLNREHWNIYDFITETTTPAAFDQKCEEYPNYTIVSAQKFNPVYKATMKGNIELIEHIVRNKEGKENLFVLNSIGAPPIMGALSCLYAKPAIIMYKTVKKLIELGVSVNTEFYKKSILYIIIKKDTYVNIDVLKLKHIELITYLIDSGAEAKYNDEISQEVVEVVSSAKEIIKINKKIESIAIQFIFCINNNPYLNQYMISDIRQLIVFIIANLAPSLISNILNKKEKF